MRLDVDVEISQATRDDLDSVARIDDLVVGDARGREAADQWIADGACYVSRTGAAVVGFAVLEDFFGFGFVRLLIVDPKVRRRGVGTALMRYLESISPTQKLFTSTNESNVPMQRLAESLGYERTGYVENLDEGDPEIIFYKRLIPQQP
jgi:ribosomal protein S18 acetylase RimI-like enzyme